MTRRRTARRPRPWSQHDPRGRGRARRTSLACARSHGGRDAAAPGVAWDQTLVLQSSWNASRILFLTVPTSLIAMSASLQRDHRPVDVVDGARGQGLRPSRPPRVQRVRLPDRVAEHRLERRPPWAPTARARPDELGSVGASGAGRSRCRRCVIALPDLQRGAGHRLERLDRGHAGLVGARSRHQVDHLRHHVDVGVLHVPLGVRVGVARVVDHLARRRVGGHAGELDLAEAPQHRIALPGRPEWRRRPGRGAGKAGRRPPGSSVRSRGCWR